MRLSLFRAPIRTLRQDGRSPAAVAIREKQVSDRVRRGGCSRPRPANRVRGEARRRPTRARSSSTHATQPAVRPSTRTTLSREVCPRTMLTRRAGTPARRATRRHNAAFAAPSTGGAVTRISRRPPRSPPISSRRARGITRTLISAMPDPLPSGRPHAPAHSRGTHHSWQLPLHQAFLRGQGLWSGPGVGSRRGFLADSGRARVTSRVPSGPVGTV